SVVARCEGHERRELDTGRLFRREVPDELDLAIVVDDVAFGVERVDQFETVGRTVHPRRTMPRLWLSAVAVVMRVSCPSRYLQPDLPRWQSLVPRPVFYFV